MADVFDHRCDQARELEVDFDQISKNEKRTLWVVVLTSFMMVAEIVAGYITGSMALLADGYHMASHAGALAIAYVVYRMARSQSLAKRLTFGTGKLLPLGGYTSAIALGIIALWMIAESVYRLLHPIDIKFEDAIVVACLGLVVNLLSAWILGSGHHGHDHHEHSHDHHDDHKHAHVHDHNHRSAFVHVLADALTSVLAIVALIVGSFYGSHWLDPVMGIVGALVIIKWASGLCRSTANELLDAQVTHLKVADLKALLKEDGVELLDFHLWKVGPDNFASSLSVKTKVAKGDAYYRSLIGKKNLHLVVNERVI